MISFDTKRFSNLSHSRDVDVGGLSDGLVVNSGVGDDDDPRLLERSGDVVGEVTRGAAKRKRKNTQSALLFSPLSQIPLVFQLTIDRQWR